MLPRIRDVVAHRPRRRPGRARSGGATIAAFVAEVRRIAAEGEVAEVEDFEFGRKYTVPGELKGPRGAARVVTVWMQEAGREDVRLVTVRPE